MRRLSVFASVVAVLLLGRVAQDHIGPTAAQDTTPLADGQGFGGSWRVTATLAQGPPSHSLGTIDADGTIVVSILPAQPPPGAPGGVIFASSAHGAWEATGPDAAIFTFVSLLADGQGNPFGTVTVRANATLAPDGQTFSGTNTVTIADPGGNTVATIPGTIQAARIVAEAPEMPTTGTPTA